MSFFIFCYPAFLSVLYGNSCKCGMHNMYVWLCLNYLTCICMSSGAEFHAGLALSEEVEDHRSGLHLLSSC